MRHSHFGEKNELHGNEDDLEDLEDKFIGELTADLKYLYSLSKSLFSFFHTFK